MYEPDLRLWVMKPVLIYLRDDTPPGAAAFPLEDLAALLAARHPRTALGAVLAQSSWAVDAEMVDDAAGVVLRGGEEVAVICPVSGG